MNRIYTLCVIFPLSTYPIQGAETDIYLSVLDKAAGKPIPCRIHLKDAANKPVHPDKLPFWNDHFVCPGTVTFNLPPGRYSYEIERGPEWALEKGQVTVADKEQRLKVELKRLADLPGEGWWPGELHVHRPPGDVELLMQAEDLHVAPVITWWNNRNHWTSAKRLPDNPLISFDKNRFYHLMAGEDEREGGALLFFNLREPLAITGATREYPSPMKFLAHARRTAGVHVDIEKPFWWDVPIWLASGQVDTIGIANNHMNRDKMYETEAWGKPRDAKRLPAPRGNGYWTQEIYYHILNTGLRIAPSAGSASGVLANPVGYNRAYVHLDKDLAYEKWFQGLRAGRSFITNGPLLRVKVNDQLPDHVFTADKELELDIQADLTSRDKISNLEIIKNGKVERSLPSPLGGEPGVTGRVRGNSLGKVKFTESGWLLVRAIADNDKTFRFASTAPFYVEIGPNKRRISKASIQFFLDWVDEREKRVKLTDPEQRKEVLAHHEMARTFWDGRMKEANAK